MTPGWVGGRVELAWRRPGLILFAAGLASAAVYGWLAWGFPATGASEDVARFLAWLAALFGLYGLAALAVRRAEAPKPEATFKQPPPDSGRGPAGRRRTLVWVLLFAALFRLLMAFAGLPRERPLDALRQDLTAAGPAFDTYLLYDNDLWRYLWDGHVVATGGDPYARTPRQHVLAAEALAAPAPPLESEFWWDLLDNVSFQTYTSVYPPLAQALFALSHALAPGSVLVWKLLVGLIDLAGCLALAGIARALGARPQAVLLYAWNPLVVKEVAGSGHLDGAMVALMLAAVWLLLRRAPAAALVVLALAASVKLAALALAPWFLRRLPPRRWWILPATLAAVWWPWRAGLGELAGGLAAYGREWVFNTGPWAALRALAAGLGAAAPETWAHALAKTLLLGVAGFAFAADRGEPRHLVRAAFLVLAALVVLNPAVMPWYLLWALPFAALLACPSGRLAAAQPGARSWLVFTALSLLSYRVYAGAPAAGLWLWAEWGLFGLAAGLEALGRRPAGPGRGAGPDRNPGKMP